ncbi:MAG: GHKL domain-containing protein [Peptostreptococcaceae bacterium]
MLENELFWSIVNNGIFIVEWMLIYFLFKTLSKPKTSSVVIYIMIFGASLTGIILDAIGIDPNIKVLIHIAISFILYKINFNISLQRCTITVLIFWMVAIGVEAIVMSVIMNICNEKDATIFLINGEYRLVSMIIAKGIMVLLLLVIRNHKISNKLRTRDIVYISLPIFTNIIFILTVFDEKLQPLKKLSKTNMEILMLTILVFISNISILLLVGKIVRENKLSLENKFIKDKLKTQYDYYERIKEKQFRTRQLYHDMKNHLACIERLNNSNESKKYINNIKQEIYKLENNFDTGNMILDIVLDEKYGICEEKNISFVSKVDSRQIDFMEEIDICSIFSNALDNAIEACDKVIDSDKKISIVSTYIKNFFIIKIENNKVNEITLKDGKINTNKKDKFLHGIGIEGIKRTVEKYEGEVVTDYSENNFVLKIMIPLITYKI